AVETYERLKAAMRMYRVLKSQGKDTKNAELDVAYTMGWLGHYVGDGAMPLHDSIHHDGWQGENPKGYTTDPRVHGRFESQFVDLIEAKETDIRDLVQPAKKLQDPFTAILAHLDLAFTHVEAVYVLDAEGAYAKKDHAGARSLVFERLSSAAGMLRDLTYTAWVESAATPSFDRDPAANPISPKNPRYNPATGSAPAAR
ncbi:MAG: nuclease, partial [Bryobacteraceae bacterium]|nr:nuclease [Bryobacteraceae bacterium]